VIERRLRDLALIKLTIGGDDLKVDEVGVFQKEIARLVGVWSFGDWILLLRHMIFYFEDRRALVWDASAQRQLLRFLLLPAATAKKWTESEREILELDSRMRNLRFAVYREEQALAIVESKVRTSADVREELATLEQLQAVDVAARNKLDDAYVSIDERRRNAGLRYLKAQQERESRYRGFERAKLMAVEARFPKKSDRGRLLDLWAPRAVSVDLEMALCMTVRQCSQSALRFPVVEVRGRYSIMPRAGARGSLHLRQKHSWGRSFRCFGRRSSR
jgi:hypothetical protein